ncbi:MAG: Glu-tRNA(Gln) amidotransferase subunit GatE [Candidatus Helarchaeota archaeon]
MTELNYEEIGLICGIEIHQRLNSKEKLFCACSPKFNPEDESIYTIKRKLRSVPGELGDVDPAALYEYYKDKLFEYHCYKGKTCLVELDEEPPHPVNREALEIALTVATMLNMFIPDEIECMRKTVIDGSNTSGFQRTMNVGIGLPESTMKTSFGPVRVKDLELEEESAGIIDKSSTGIVAYRLDRLGIPLIEIGTHPDIHHPVQAREVAEFLGMTCRMTGNAQRGLGTIRQDVNISIKGGARVEVKGLQDLRMIAKLVENEVIRQVKLLEIRDELNKKGLKELTLEIEDFTPVFQGTNSKIIKTAIKNKGKVLGIVLPKFSGLMKRILYEEKTLAREFVDYSKAHGVRGFIHSDEKLEKYGLVKEFNAIRKKLKLDDADLILIMAGKESTIKEALNSVIERARYCLIGVPEETRMAQIDGTTNYLRPLPGSARMYPETDIPPVKVSKDLLKKIKNNLPELPDDKKKRFMKELKLNDDLAGKIVRSHDLFLFEDLVGKFPKISPTLISNTLLTMPSELKKKHGVELDKIRDEFYMDIFKLIEDDTIDKDAIPKILLGMIKNPKKSALDIAKQKKLLQMDVAEIEKIIKKILDRNKTLIQERGEKAIGALMGEIMKELRGKASGKTINKLLKRLIKEHLP